MFEFKQIQGLKELHDPDTELLFTANDESEIKQELPTYIVLCTFFNFLEQKLPFLMLQVSNQLTSWTWERRKIRDEEERGKVTNSVVIYYLAFLSWFV